MYSKTEIEDRNLAIAKYELNYEFLKTYIINFCKENIDANNISFKKCIDKLVTEKIITEHELKEILIFSKKKTRFCRFINQNSLI